ncbi:MAG TPA: flagellin [Jatrophihabitans sp.]|jgi:flagellar hook-associated protein 3 FlgL
MRVTDSSMKYGSLQGIESANSRLQSLNLQMSTGNQITKPSDDPSNTVRALQLRGDVKRNSQFAANANDAIGYMSTADSAYQQMISIAQKAQTLVVQGLNTGTADATSNTALADQVHSIREEMLSLSNTEYNGRPVFGGNTTSDVAYKEDATTGNVYFVGDQTTVNRQVGETTVVQINQTATDAFGAPSTSGSTPGSDIFSVLQNIESALRNSPSTLSASDLSAIGASVTTMSAAQAKEGAAYNRVTVTQAAATTTNLALTTELSNIQDIDLAAQAVAVSTASVTYQSALQTTANIRQMSLLNFLQ